MIKACRLFIFLPFLYMQLFSAYTTPIKTIDTATEAVRKIINNFPAKESLQETYKKTHSLAMVQATKILYDQAQIQILEALQEIGNRIFYWQYQKDHGYRYFFSKNPLKWFSGPSQDTEIENNLSTLKSHQGELFVLLGQLSHLEDDFNKGYKDIFLVEYQKAYEWIEKVLSALIRIKTTSSFYNESFIENGNDLIQKLKNVSYFKSTLLSDIQETAIPSRIERNWLKYSMLLLALGYGYDKISYEQLSTTYSNITKKVTDYIIHPVYNLVSDLIYPKQQQISSLPEINPKLAAQEKATIPLMKDFVNEASIKYEIDDTFTKQVLTGIEEKDYSNYLQFLNIIEGKETRILPEQSLYEKVKSKTIPTIVEKGWVYRDYAHGMSLFAQLFGMQSLRDTQKFALDFIQSQKQELATQYAAVGKLVLLIPAVFAGGLAYMGYQKLTATNYDSLRKALVHISSLFVDHTKALSDEQYGQMMYLLYNLKQDAQKKLSRSKSTFEEFITDLERVESREYDVAAKRRIIKDMFKKYTFLGLIQKKSA